MLLASCRLCAVVVSCLAGSFLAERSEDSAARSAATQQKVDATHAATQQRIAATQQKLDALQEKQESILKKLEVEAHAARSTQRVGAEGQAVREALVAKMKSHVKELKTQIEHLGSPEFAYSNFKQAAANIRSGSQAIGEAIDRMTPGLPGMIEKSQEYQRKNAAMLAGYKTFEDHALWATQEKVHKSKNAEIADMEAMPELNEKDEERARRENATEATLDLIKLHKFKHLDQNGELQVDFGQNPYKDMSRTDMLPVKMPAATEYSMKEWMRQSRDVDRMPDDNIVINVPAPTSFVQVLPHSLELQRNSSHVGK